jgi:hypothetical protein
MNTSGWFGKLPNKMSMLMSLWHSYLFSNVLQINPKVFIPKFIWHGKLNIPHTTHGLGLGKKSVSEGQHTKMASKDS